MNMNIQISHLSKSFGGQEILKDASFTVSEGEKVALLGKNGSGKSTLFKILMEEETPDAGQVIISPKTVRIGYLPQVIDDNNPLSSGQKFKKRLQEILVSKPDILVLDEPTNHLDWQGMHWLERVVMSFPGPVLIVSHDRYFLDRTVDKLLELDNGEIKVYGGNYSLYKQQKQIEQESHLRSYEKQQKQARKLQADLLEKRRTVQKSNTKAAPTRDNDKFVAFFFANRVGRKFGKQIQALESRLENMDKVDKPEPNWELKALFRPKQESSQTVVYAKSINYRNVLKDVSLNIQRGQRLALIGNNGSGKTTLIKLILGQLSPDSGELIIGNGVQIGYLSQEHHELESDKIVLEELTSGNIDKTESYKLLRRFLLPTEKINQSVKLLSSGEKAKLLLAKIMTSGANFIILDEPTNHLDIPSREAIEESLANYPGTLLVISHDRYFLERVGITDYYEAREGGILKI
jgi:ATPase subunit of ABC transporter with duplicated ATPase domains